MMQNQIHSTIPVLQKAIKEYKTFLERFGLGSFPCFAQKKYETFTFLALQKGKDLSIM